MDPTTNSCGIYWSDGKIQSSTDKFSTRPTSFFDHTCYEHDRRVKRCGHNDGCQTAADDIFIKRNWGKGFRQSIAAGLVYTNRFRRMDQYNPYYITSALPEKPTSKTAPSSQDYYPPYVHPRPPSPKPSTIQEREKSAPAMRKDKAGTLRPDPREGNIYYPLKDPRPVRLRKKRKKRSPSNKNSH